MQRHPTSSIPEAETGSLNEVVIAVGVQLTMGAFIFQQPRCFWCLTRQGQVSWKTTKIFMANLTPCAGVRILIIMKRK